ncbi:MAG: YbaY family lipoprotein [Chloroflexota bacterium]
MSNLLVTGAILIPEKELLPGNAVAYVHLLDTSLADAPATIVSSQVIENLARVMDKERKIKFALSGQIEDFKANYSVSVHIDVDNDGQISLGDYVNVQSYPVITFGYPKQVEVKTVKVT